MNTSSTVSRVTLDVLDSNPPPAAARRLSFCDIIPDHTLATKGKLSQSCPTTEMN